MEQKEGAEQNPEQENETSGENTTNLHNVQLLLLEKLTQFVPLLTKSDEVSGVLAIPFLQVNFGN